MFDSLMQAVKMLDRSARRVSLGVVVVVAVIAALNAYDTNRQESRLTSLERTVTLLRDSKAMMLDASDPELKEVSELLRSQALDVLRSSVAPPRHLAYWKFLAAMGPWLVLFLANVFGDRAEGIVIPMLKYLNVLLWGTAFGLIGAFLPDSHLLWLNMVVYPVGHFLIVVAIALVATIDKATEPPDMAEVDGEPDPE